MNKIFLHIKNIGVYLVKRENLRPTLIGLGVICFLWFTVFGNQGLYHLHKSIKLRTALKNTISEQKGKIEELEKKKSLLNNPSHLELVIRQELGYVKPGEVVYQLSNEDNGHESAK